MITVVIPLYNGAKTIESTLDSIRFQTINPPFECIVVDDGSTDNSSEIVLNYAERYRNELDISLIHQCNSGVSSARNTGVLNAHGDWITFLDSDDCWLPAKMEEQLTCIHNNPHIRFLGTTRSASGSVDSNQFTDSVVELMVADLLYSWKIHMSTIIAHRSLFHDSLWFDPSMQRCEDADFLLRIAEVTPIYLMDKCLVLTGGGKRMYGESGLSQDVFLMRKGERKAVQKSFSRKQISLMRYIYATLFQELKFYRRVLLTLFFKYRPHERSVKSAFLPDSIN